MPDLTPDDVARREFRSGFRGFETSEVRAFLEEVAAGLAALVQDRDALAVRLAQVESPDLKAEIANISREVGEVLQTARQAAESMRERAGVDATRWRSEAIAEADAERSRAAIDAERLRSDAWTTSEQLLSQCQVQASRVIEAAEKEALRLVGEAERESHRMQAAARRESDDMVRTARMEVERLTAEAKARHDELIDAAMKQSEAAQERTLALDQRRQELLRELESVRATLSQVEGELDQRRERMGLSPPEPMAAKVVTASPPPRPTAPPAPAKPKSDDTGLWEPGETVRVVRPERSGDAAPVAEVTPQRLEPEVKILSGKQFARIKAGLDPGEGEPTEEAAEPKPVNEVLNTEAEDASVKVVLPATESPAGPPGGPPGEPPEVAERPSTDGEPVVETAIGPETGAPSSPAVEPVDEQDGPAGVVVTDEVTDDESDEAAKEVAPDKDQDADGVDDPIEFDAVEIPATMPEPTPPSGSPIDAEPQTEPVPSSTPPSPRSVPHRPIGQRVPRPSSPARLQSAPRIVAGGANDSAASSDEEQPQLFTEVAGLFDRLRTDEIPVPVPSRARDMEQVMSRRLTASVVDPFEVRDRLLLPIGNRALRNLKRQLTEAQNEALEEIRLDEGHWQPTADAIRNRVRADLVVLFAESYGAGHSAAEEMMGGRVPRPATPRDEVATDFVEDLTRELTQVLAEGRHSGHGARQLGASLSRVFRGWRTDQSERRVRAMSLWAYHSGLIRSLELTDVTELQWKVAGRGCATCRAASEERPGALVPPAHPGCECTVAP